MLVAKHEFSSPVWVEPARELNFRVVWTVVVVVVVGKNYYYPNVYIFTGTGIYLFYAICWS